MDTNLKISNPTDVAVSYGVEFIGLEGETYASFTGALSPRQAENIDIRAKLENLLGSVEMAKGKIQIVSDNPVAAVLTYNDFNTGKLNIACVKAVPFHSDYAWGNGIVAIDADTTPTKFYVNPAAVETWMEFPTTFTVLDSEGNGVALTNNRLDLGDIGAEEIKGFTVENHAGHQTRIIFIGDKGAAIASPVSRKTYTTTTGSDLSIYLSIDESDMFQSISKLELYKNDHLVNTYASVPSNLIIPKVASGSETYQLKVMSGVDDRVIDEKIVEFYVEGESGSAPVVTPPGGGVGYF